MRYKNECRSHAAMQRENEVHDLRAGFAIEISGRLVGKQDLGLRRKRPRQRHALLLAAGQLARDMVMARGKSDIGKGGLGALERISPIEELERQRHILDRGHSRDQVKGLKYDADGAASHLGEPVLAHSREVLARNEHLPRCGGFEPCHDHQERRLSGAAWSHQRNRLPFRRRKVDAAQNLDRSRPALECERHTL